MIPFETAMVVFYESPLSLLRPHLL